MYKVGDKVLCKKNYSCISGKIYDPPFFIKRHWYKIYNVYWDSVKECFWFDILGEDGGDWRGFSNIKLRDMNFFDEYFYTLSELRKKKLEKLNEDKNIKKRKRWLVV